MSTTIEIVSIHGTIDGMRTTIDSAGRVVVPKDLRAALNLNGGDEVEITLEGERLTLTPAPRQVQTRRGPHGLLTAEFDIPPHGPEKVREELERTRR
ncbi:MAG TPA: AbrB/MazE/SpoVT family DNA-binding domain-containing protein [Solirubrobacterales bacterium]|nr:AbrB/MazE/SpoVT family DNA-binding domain-containing protein [Solirubrobacterales bacterium]